MKQFFALGSYTEPILFGTGEVFPGKGKGISICSFENGNIETIREIPVKNPSFLCIDENSRKIYAVNELKEYLGEEGGGLTQFSYDEDYSVSVEGTWNTAGKDPCHAAVSPDRKFIAIANYSSGSVTTYPVDEKGNIIGNSRTVSKHEGKSIHPVRQTEPHAHSCIFNGDSNLMYVPDLGLDRVFVYDYSKDNSSGEASDTISVPAGSGPRFGEFSSDGRHFYLINELSARIIHYSVEEGQLIFLRAVDTLPENPIENCTCADLHLTPDGTKLYASIRGMDSIICFKVESNGDLSFLERQPCGGKTPRNFAIDPSGSYLLSGNQDSDTITVFSIEANGHLEMINERHTGSPVCIRFFA